jgi:RNA polymerase sigma-70 factor (ECF subfamily)
MDDSLKVWFTREILAHEAALMRYLMRVWRDPDDVVDLRQETYVRVYEAARKARPVHAKSFLFTTARNLMVDRVRRARIVSIDLVADLEALNVPVDELSPERRAGALDDLRRVSNALDRMPERCRAVVWLRKVEGLSQREVAARLGISEGTVEKHITRGIRRLAMALFGSDGQAAQTDTGTGSEPVSDHAKQRAD